MNASIRSFDERRDIIIPGNMKETLTFCAEHFIVAFQEAVADHGSFRVALSGGSTPKALYALLTEPPYANKIDWNRIHLFWSDERNVPPDHVNSNYHMAMQAGFAKMNIPNSQIHRMVGEKNIQEGAAAYDSLLQTELKGQGFDYVCLGMGKDGHTASLFPGTKGLSVKGRLVIANEIPQKDTWRMTFTFDCINNAKHIVLYVLGEDKKEMVQRVFSTKEEPYPVQKIGTPQHKALWILDWGASSLLFP